MRSMAAQTELTQQPRLTCAPWCADQGAHTEDPAHCMSATDDILTLDRRDDENGVCQRVEVRVGINRQLGDYRPAGLRREQTHTVSLGVDLEGWSCDNWVHLTVPAATELRDRLTVLLGQIEEDRAALGEVAR